MPPTRSTQDQRPVFLDRRHFPGTTLSILDRGLLLPSHVLPNWAASHAQITPSLQHGQQDCRIAHSGVCHPTLLDPIMNAIPLLPRWFQAVALGSSICTLQAGEHPATFKLVHDAAEAFLQSLRPEQRKKATFPLDDEERENWHYVPMDRAGLSLKEMDQTQKRAAMDILRQAMSDKGLLKAEQIISLEGVLAKLENNPQKRDMEKYWVAVFGEPGMETAWALRFEGHHLSVNLTFADKQVSVTPTFMGTNPAEVRSGEKQGLRALASEEDQGRELAKSLAANHPSVVFSDKAPDEILTGQERKYTQLQPVGVLAADMTDDQRALLIKLLQEYTGNYRPDLAEADMKRIAAQGIGNIRFGWAGSLKKGEAYYYRIQGPTFLMEAANTQNNANHMHVVWRDAERDFGRDILGDHHHE